MVIINKGASALTKLKLKQGETKMKTYNEFYTYFQHNPSVAGVMATKFHTLRNKEYRRALRDYIKHQAIKIDVEYEETA